MLVGEVLIMSVILESEGERRSSSGLKRETVRNSQLLYVTGIDFSQLFLFFDSEDDTRWGH